VIIFLFWLFSPLLVSYRSPHLLFVVFSSFCVGNLPNFLFFCDLLIFWVLLFQTPAGLIHFVLELFFAAFLALPGCGPVVFSHPRRLFFSCCLHHCLPFPRPIQVYLLLDLQFSVSLWSVRALHVIPLHFVLFPRCFIFSDHYIAAFR